MTKFHLGLLVGFFLGALFMGVTLGIIYLYFEERREKNARACEKAVGELQDAIGTKPYADDQPPGDLSCRSLGEPGAKRKPTTYYLSVIIE
jgi:hypothetical protein